ncbi:LCP family protein [Miniphocaeibacter halophilus]|uniref:LCP family protein n=1 Tax=Miniphocaeibacter halophilus TaxID=2931922 RepID=A0AC61MR28_9FIRM|nr:LCP family protein [Miniphocaeibacter halophilus]QQK08017.1 LCP family protein [Miniphocaeibacter halophilus]
MKLRSIVIFFVSLVVIGGTWYVVDEVLDLKAKSTVDIDGESLGKGNRIETVVDDELMFLVVGVDKNIDAVGEAQNTRVRTDTMILTTVNFEKGTIDLISLPRDTKIKYEGSFIKLGEAHSYGGIEGTLKAVRNLTGLDIDYYMSVDYDAVLRLVEVIGGVEVDSPQEINAPEINIHIPKGRTVLDENQSLYFLRAREVLKNRSDLERMKNQQYFLKQLVKEVTKPSNLLKIPELLEVYKDNVTTNIDLGSLGNVALQAAKFDSSKMTTQTLEGTDDYEYNANGKKISYFYVDEKKMNELFSKRYPDYFLDKAEVDKYETENTEIPKEKNRNYNFN